MQKRKLYVEGMTCSSCEQKVVTAFKRTSGVKFAQASYQTGAVYIQGERLPENEKLEI